MAAADDPVRADVERWVRAFVAAAWAVPGAAVARVGRCVNGRMGAVTKRVAEPMRLVRSVLELATGARTVAGGSATVSPPVAATPPGSAPPEATSPEPSDLPIEEYQSLAASHVVARLANLSVTELQEVRRFEVAHRGRRTVIGRIDQLLGAAAKT